MYGRGDWSSSPWGLSLSPQRLPSALLFSSLLCLPKTTLSFSSFPWCFKFKPSEHLADRTKTWNTCRNSNWQPLWAGENSWVTWSQRGRVRRKWEPLLLQLTLKMNWNVHQIMDRNHSNRERKIIPNNLTSIPVVGCLYSCFLLIAFILKGRSEVAQSCLTLWDPMDCNQQGSSVYGIFQARVLEWVAISFSRGSSWPRNGTQVSCIAGRRFTVWATRKALIFLIRLPFKFLY